jgi:hypothetical protein
MKAVRGWESPVVLRDPRVPRGLQVQMAFRSRYAVTKTAMGSRTGWRYSLAATRLIRTNIPTTSIKMEFPMHFADLLESGEPRARSEM